DRAAVDAAHRDHAGEGPGDEGFLGRVGLGQAEVLLEGGDPGFATGTQDVAAGDAVQAVVAGRGPDLALAHGEEMGRVAGRDESVWIGHQGFVGAGFRAWMQAVMQLSLLWLLRRGSWTSG